MTVALKEISKGADEWGESAHHLEYRVSRQGSNAKRKDKESSDSQSRRCPLPVSIN